MNSTLEKLSDEIINLSQISKQSGIKNVYVSLILPKNDRGYRILYLKLTTFLQNIKGMTSFLYPTRILERVAWLRMVLT